MLALLALMPPRLLVRLALSAAAFAAGAFAAPRLARAQDVGVNLVPSEVRKLTASRGTLDRRIPPPNELGISYLDCVEDVVYAFPLSFTGSPSQRTIEAWVSAENVDCSAEKRTSTTNAECWRVYQDTLNAQPSRTLYVRSQDIVSQIQRTAKTNPSPPADASACTSVTTSSIVKLTLTWLVFDGTTVKSSVKFPLSVDVVAPQAPSLTSARGGDGLVFVNIVIPGTTVTDDEGGTTTSGGGETDLSGYVVYCDPPPDYEKASTAGLPQPNADDPSQCTADRSIAFKTLPTKSTSSALRPQVTDGGDDASSDAGDAAASGDAGEDAGTSVDAGSGTKVDAGTSSGGTSTGTTGLYVDERFICAEIGAGTANRITVKGNFKIGYPYHVAVASRDTFGNASVVSDIRCAVPVKIDDFWTLYKGAGGAATGCALEGAGLGGGAAPAAGLGLLALTALRARRRRPR